MSGEKLSGIETTALRKDGSTFPAIMYPSLIVKGKKPVGVRGIVVDITEQQYTLNNSVLDRVLRAENIAVSKPFTVLEL